MKKSEHVCPPWLSWTLINPIRSLSQDPEKTLRPFVKEGDAALDVGCGPGYFTTALARLVGGNGLVIAADIQGWMLERVRRRVEKAGLSGRVRLHLGRADCLDVPPDRVDFALAFWMVHEVPDKERLFSEILACLVPGGTLLLAEPRLHVNAKAFAEIAGTALKAGFVSAGPVPIRFSRAALLRKP
ncbi:MAG TPA: class I SAM-dependent methyltransferase [Acidobacteriota bacterium]|nr:class I SAM-dependent methyltransferase [Acidobacteriota bacterium]